MVDHLGGGEIHVIELLVLELPSRFDKINIFNRKHTSQRFGGRKVGLDVFIC